MLVLQRVRQDPERHKDAVSRTPCRSRQAVKTLDTSEDVKLFLAAECAKEQGFFEAFHTAAMHLVGRHRGAPHWTVVADSVGVRDRSEFDRCVRTARYAAEIDGAYAEGIEFGVRVVPTSFINGEVYEGSLDLLALDSAVARALPRPRR